MRDRKSPLTTDKLLIHYQEKRKLIRDRLLDFKKLGACSDERKIFEELVFCILAAGTSARLALKTVDHIRNILMDTDEDQLSRALKEVYRFYKVRARYIIHTRNYISNHLGFKLKEHLANISNHEERRDFLALNSNIKGIGMKEASHFLRNIGFSGYAILDKHILRSLYELNVIECPKPPTTKKRYLEIESKLKEFARLIRIECDELDLVLWSLKTGEIVK